MRIIRRSIILLLLVGLMTPALLPAGEIWDGGGADNNWTTGRNWNGPIGFEFPPLNNGNANVHMAGNQQTTNVVNVPWSINSLTFDAGSLSFFVTGQELTIGAGGITNNDNALQLVLAPIRLAADQTWNAAAGPLQANAINLNGFDLTMGGAFNTTLNGAISGFGFLNLPSGFTGTVTISGNTSNTNVQQTVVNGGTLVLQKTSGAATGVATFLFTEAPYDLDRANKPLHREKGCCSRRQEYWTSTDIPR